MIDYTLLPEMFFFTPYTKEEMIDDSDFLNDMYMALLDVDREWALDLMNEAMARLLRFSLVEAAERKFDLHCRLQPDKEEGGSRLKHEGLLNLLVACMFSRFSEENLRENHCLEAKRMLERNIGRNRAALVQAGYDELLEIMEESYSDGGEFIIMQRPDLERLSHAAEAMEIEWHKFIKNLEDKDFDKILIMTQDLECAVKVFNSLFNSIQVTKPDGSDGLREYAEAKFEVVKKLPLWNMLGKLDEAKKLLAEEEQRTNELLQQKDEEIARLRSLLAKHGLNPDENESEDDLSDVADVEIPDMVLYHFRGDRTLALRYLKGCHEHNSPAKAMHDYEALGQRAIQRGDRMLRHGFFKQLCNWLNANGCTLKYDSFKSK